MIPFHENADPPRFAYFSSSETTLCFDYLPLKFDTETALKMGNKLWLSPYFRKISDLLLKKGGGFQENTNGSP